MPQGDSGRGLTEVDHVDFEGATLTRMPPSATVDASLWIDGNGEVLERHETQRGDRGWKFVVRFRTLDRGKPVELRAHLKRGSEALSETWSYILPAS